MSERELIPPTLADIGWALWGSAWAEALAETMDVTLEDVARWENDPESRPAHLEAELNTMCDVYVKEIYFVQSRLKQTGLARADNAKNGVSLRTNNFGSSSFKAVT
jgi:hypothetical protein